jgi:hypothetical protein
MEPLSSMRADALAERLHDFSGERAIITPDRTSDSQVFDASSVRVGLRDASRNQKGDGCPHSLCGCHCGIGNRKQIKISVPPPVLQRLGNPLLFLLSRHDQFSSR